MGSRVRLALLLRGKQRAERSSHLKGWQTKNASYVSRSQPDAALARQLIDDGIGRVNARSAQGSELIPPCNHIVMEDYGKNAPYAVNWAQNAQGIRAFGWETGTQLADEVWTDAYMEMFYRSIHWMTRRPEVQ